MSCVSSTGIPALLCMLALVTGCASHAAAPLPDPKDDAPLAKSSGTQTAVFAGGCFWGVEAVFEHVKGVKEVVSGYSGGKPEAANYEAVSSGATGHAEAVRIAYDPSRISYGQLLKIFFTVAHDPTQRDRQGPDIGPQYRSAIFFASAEQKRIAESYIAQLSQARAFSRPIATEVTQLKGFFPAEDYHQDYLAKHPNQPYIVIHDLPKLASLQRQFPALYTGR